MGSLRLISGRLGGRILRTPETLATHPMSERARAAIFNVLLSAGFNFSKASVLDLFAGSGALGLEALSRGASGIVFVEKNHKAIITIDDNSKRLGVSDKVRIINGDIFSTAIDLGDLDLVFCDPPYGDFLSMREKLADFLDGVEAHFLVISRPEKARSLALSNWRLFSSKVYADASIDFFIRYDFE